MRELTSEFLFTLHADLHKPKRLGQTPLGQRLIFDVMGGRIEGRINGKLLPSGGDWLLNDADGCSRLDVRATIELDDGCLLYASYVGRLFVPLELRPRFQQRSTAVQLDPSSYYFRTVPTFETAFEKYHWLNHIVSVGVGRLTETGVAYDLYEIT